MLFVILVGNIGTGKTNFTKRLNLRNKCVFEVDKLSETDPDTELFFKIKEGDFSST